MVDVLSSCECMIRLLGRASLDLINWCSHVILDHCKLMSSNMLNVNTLIHHCKLMSFNVICIYLNDP